MNEPTVVVILYNVFILTDIRHCFDMLGLIMSFILKSTIAKSKRRELKLRLNNTNNQSIEVGM